MCSDQHSTRYDRMGNAWQMSVVKCSNINSHPQISVASSLQDFLLFFKRQRKRAHVLRTVERLKRTIDSPMLEDDAVGFLNETRTYTLNL